MLILGSSGRIGQLLRHQWGQGAAVWHSRRGGQDGGFAVQFDLLADATALRQAAYRRQILCLAGPVPTNTPQGPVGDDAMQAHVSIACAAIQAAHEAADHAQEPARRVVLASSAAVYGAPKEGAQLHEHAVLAPTSAYGRAKAEMEEAALALGERLGVPVCILRIGNVAGFDAILGGWRPGFCLDRFADGRTPRRSYIGVQNLADVLEHVLAQPQLPEILNIAQPGVVEMSRLLEAAGHRFDLRVAPEAAIAEVVLDLTRLSQHVPQLPKASPEQLVRQWNSYTALIMKMSQLL